MVKEPNFEGEEMKLPENDQQYFVAETPKATGSPWMLVTLFIILSLIFVGLIYWYYLETQLPTSSESTPIRPTAEMNQEPETTNAEAEVETFGAMSTSDEITTIEADLESTNLDNLDAELLQIESELEASGSE